MKLLQKTIPIPGGPEVRRRFLASYAFYDIETTGLSPKHSFVYLIGLALRKGDSLIVWQFLAESRTEEPLILTAFFQKLSSARTLVTFNGLAFDLPFLKARETACGIKNDWDAFDHMDLYKLMGNYFHLFHLPNKKQKSVETFLGISRTDACTGGNLIPVYEAYEKNQDPHSETLLLLHNYEDVVGMTGLLPLLSYADFFTNPVVVSSASFHRYRPYQESLDATELLLLLNAPAPFPKPIHCRKTLCSLICQDEAAQLSVTMRHGELKYYYENYKDYYYLPEEDIAIHKSVASFMNSAHRKKATAATCYSKRTGDFLPQYDTLFTPYLYPGKKSRLSYFEANESLLSDSAALRRYASHLLKLFLKQADPFPAS